MIRYEPGNPNLDPKVLVSAMNLLPVSGGGYRVPYAPADAAYDALTGTPINAFLAEKPDSTKRLFYGTATKLYEVNTGTNAWTDRSAGGGSYASAASWHFVQYGTQTIAASKENTIQESSSGAFAALSGAPKAKTIATLDGTLAAWNVNDGSDKPDTLMISDVDSITTWTPADDNLAYSTQITDCPGGGTAIIAYRGMYVIFKARGVWLAIPAYGTSLKWNVKLFSSDYGCLSKDACIVAEDMLYFADDKGVYSFDGAQIRCITDPYWTNEFFGKMGGSGVGSFRENFAELHFDDVGKVLSVYRKIVFGGTVPEMLDFFHAYHVQTGQWGNGWGGDPGTLGGVYGRKTAAMIRATRKQLIELTGSNVTTASKEARFNIYLSGSGGSYKVANGHSSGTQGASATTSAFGDWARASTVDGVFMQIDSHTGVSVTGGARKSPGGTSQSTTLPVALSADKRADLRADGNFHALSFTFTTSANATRWVDYELSIIPTGKR